MEIRIQPGCTFHAALSVRKVHAMGDCTADVLVDKHIRALENSCFMGYKTNAIVPGETKRVQKQLQAKTTKQSTYKHKRHMCAIAYGRFLVKGSWFVIVGFINLVTVKVPGQKPKTYTLSTGVHINFTHGCSGMIIDACRTQCIFKCSMFLLDFEIFEEVKEQVCQKRHFWDLRTKAILGLFVIIL